MNDACAPKIMTLLSRARREVTRGGSCGGGIAVYRMPESPYILLLLHTSPPECALRKRRTDRPHADGHPSAENGQTPSAHETRTPARASRCERTQIPRVGSLSRGYWVEHSRRRHGARNPRLVIRMGAVGPSHRNDGWG